MSAGHHHKREHNRTPAQLKKLTDDPDYQKLWQRWAKIDTDHDMTDLAGYNLWGTVRYVDRDFFHALNDPAYAKHLGIGPIDTGLTPEQTIACLVEHEGIEKTIMDSGSNDIDTYLPAHEFATVGEHLKVKSYGGTPLKYERGLKKAIEWCEKKKLTKVPQDFACAPLLDDPDADDKRALTELKQLGIPDASKISKETVNYSESTGADRCDGCKHWNPVAQLDDELALCEVTAGAVRADRWCKKFEAAEQPSGKEELDRGGDQEQGRPASQPGSAGGAEDTGDGEQGGGGDALQQPANAQAGKPGQNPQGDAVSAALAAHDAISSTAAQPGPAIAATSAAPAPAPAAQAPAAGPSDIAALAASVGQMAKAVTDLVQKPAPKPKRNKKKRQITTRRDEHGNMVADVHDFDDAGNTVRKRSITTRHDEHGNLVADVHDATEDK